MQRTQRMGRVLARRAMQGWPAARARLAGLRRVTAGGFVMAPGPMVRATRAIRAAAPTVIAPGLVAPGLGAAPEGVPAPSLRSAFSVAVTASRMRIGAGMGRAAISAAGTTGMGFLNVRSAASLVAMGRVFAGLPGSALALRDMASAPTWDGVPTGVVAGAAEMRGGPTAAPITTKPVPPATPMLAVLRRAVRQAGLNGLAGSLSAAGTQVGVGGFGAARAAAGPPPQAMPGPQAPGPAAPPAAAGLNGDRFDGGMALTAPAAPPIGGRARLQGDVFLDGSKVGTWVESLIERRAGRPPVGPTGFDPRLSAMWGGATSNG